MSELALIWFTFGAANWLYTVNHLRRSINLGDFVLAMPVCALLGPIPVLVRWMK